MNRTVFALLFTSLALVTLLGCQSPVEEDKDLPVTTKAWEVNDNAYQFYTNDAAKYNYWFSYNFANSDTSAVFTEFTGVAKKVSGSKTQGFGFRFCNVDSDNYCRILIDINGYYQVSKVSAGTWSTPIPWTLTSTLYKGMKVENTIRVLRSGNYFYLYFNGTYVNNFYESSLTRDSFATLITIGDATTESFPNTPEDVRIRFTKPNVLPASAKSLVSQELMVESTDRGSDTFSAHR